MFDLSSCGRPRRRPARNAPPEVGSAGGAHNELGHEIRLNQARFEPFVNLAHVSVTTGSFRETGGAAALASAQASTDTTFLTVGIRGGADIKMGVAEGRFHGTVGWQHAFGDIVPVSMLAFAGSDAFTVAGIPLGRDALMLGAGLELDLSPSAALGLSWQSRIANSTRDHGFKASLAIAF